MKKLIKIFLTFFLFFLLIFIINKYIIKNRSCRTEEGKYEILTASGYSIDITDKIKNDECECLSKDIFINKKPKTFTDKQLELIRIELPNWAIENVSNFFEEDKIELIKELNEFTDEELLSELKYRYSFFDEIIGCEVPVYTIEVKSFQAYCLDYEALYESYQHYPPGFEKFKKQYPMIENENWARNKFGEEGVI